MATPSGAFVFNTSPTTIVFKAFAAISSTRSTISFTWATAFMRVTFIALSFRATSGSCGMSAFSRIKEFYLEYLCDRFLPSGMSVSYGRLDAASKSVRGISSGLFVYKTLFRV